MIEEKTTSDEYLNNPKKVTECLSTVCFFFRSIPIDFEVAIYGGIVSITTEN